MAKKASTAPTTRKKTAVKKKTAVTRKKAPAVKIAAAPVKKKDKYLVTGACGFTGSHLCEILTERGLDFRATDLGCADTCVLPAGTEFVPSDLTDPESLKAVVEGIDIVLHPAAIFDWWTPREVLEAVNVQGTENLCIAARDAGVRRLVSWSTSGVYGCQKFDDLPICECHPKEPIEDYSITKHMQDQVVHRYNGGGGMTTCIIRPGVVYGPRAQYGAAQVFDVFAILPIIPVPVNFKYRFGVVHVRDIAGAAIYMSGKDEAAGEEYCCVDSSAVSIADFFRLIAKHMGKPVLPIYAPPMLSRNLGLAAADISEWLAKNVTKTRPLLERGPIQFFPIDMYVSNQKLRDLGYVFEYPEPDRGVEETIAWMEREGHMDASPIDLIKKVLNKK